jgi:hypothetical protein
MRQQPSPDRTFNNADSFAQAFDEAWSRLRRDGAPAAPDQAEALLQTVLDQLSDHPFAAADPAMARQVGEFRIRLLGL